MEILGVRIDNLTREEIQKHVKEILDDSPRQKFVVTLNPEIVLKAHCDEDYKKILNGADLALCDGFGLRLVSRLKGKKIKTRYPGVELADYVLGLAKKKNLGVLVVVAENSLSSPEEIERGIGEKYKLSARAKYENDDDFFESEEAKEAQIVFVNFGAPRQEQFIFENRAKFPGAKMLIGVGGTFDFLTGKMRRAPRWMRKIGLEWLFRLLQEPKRLARIWKAVVVFPILAIVKSE